MRSSLSVVTLLLVVLAWFGSAAADGKFRPVPKARGLAVKAVSYDGSTNGVLTVQVKNTSGKAQRFSAEGLYFVPDGDPDSAPQRLGAVGPLQLAADSGAGGRKDSLEVAAGETVTVQLDVFCIDSHRPSPSSSNTFTLGRTRLPRQLAHTIEASAKVAADEAGGYPAPAAKSAIQGEVWKARDKRWVKLDGEGAQEAGK